MSEINDAGPAFPSVCLGDPGHPASVPGMSLRDWFAGQALGSIPLRSWERTAGDDMAIIQAWARCAYLTADAMLAARPTKEPTDV